MSDDTPTQRYPEGFPPPGGPKPGEGDAQPAASNADVPTERFDALGADAEPTPAVEPAAPTAATIPLVEPVADAGAVPPAAVPPGATTASGDGERRGKGLIIALASLAGVLLIALIALLIWLANSNPPPAGDPSETPSATPTPSETASETPSATPTPSETPEETPSAEPPPPPPPPAGAITSYSASTTSVDCSGGGPVPLTFSWAATGTRLWFGIGTDNASNQPFAEFPLVYTTTAADGIAYQCGQPGGQQRYTITVEKSDGTYESKTIIIRE